MAERPEGAIDLPDGGWAKLRDRGDLTNGQRRLLREHTVPFLAFLEDLKERGVTSEMLEKSPNTHLPADALDRMNRAQAAVIVVYLEAWSLDLPLPTMDTVDDLPAAVFDAVATGTPAVTSANVDGTVDFSVNPDPASPTVPSRASRRSAGAPKRTSTGTRGRGTGSTGSAG